MQQPLFTRTDAALLVIISGPMVWRCTAHKRWKTCRCCWPVSHANGRIVGAHLQHYAMPSHRSQEMPGLLVRAARCYVVGDHLRPDGVALHLSHEVESMPVLLALRHDVMPLHRS